MDEVTDLVAQIDDLVAEAIRGEQYAISSNGYRSNGFRITIRALENINQLLIAQGVYLRKVCAGLVEPTRRVLPQSNNSYIKGS